MSMPTPSANSTTTPANPTSALQSSATGTPNIDTISIHDLETGKLDIASVIVEVQELKSKISGLRYEMCQYIRLLSSIEETSVPLLVFQEVSNQISVLKSQIDSYYTSYRRLLPVIRYTKLKIGLNPDDQIKILVHDVKVESKLILDTSIKSDGLNVGMSNSGSGIGSGTNSVSTKFVASTPQSSVPPASSASSMITTPGIANTPGSLAPARKNTATKKVVKPRAPTKKQQAAAAAAAAAAQKQATQQQGKQQPQKNGQGSLTQPIVL
ncbi:hypothetical protein CANARDRAFT_26653 [[Candida] arabinofermentans NRRL YB-2248]|uniref:Uncharacterized protein n=1 Tax=[Candida] arabinofermentans NRRL YB-2248 TaxID=983967 RepID=A0A1E4T677_9ASCO|nr:hypothetical protein CANARDRAFT_26653 [[Candida] arabinofermentans NRRL YB-2248]